MAHGYFELITKTNFEHIKSGGPCPLTDRVISEALQKFESRFNINHDNISPLLAQILDDHHGTEETVNMRRMVNSVEDYISQQDHDIIRFFNGGSYGDGFAMTGSDTDQMMIMTTVVVTYPDQMHLLSRHNSDKTILLMITADCRPGYAKLQIAQIMSGLGIREGEFQSAIVPIGDSFFLSSDLYRQAYVDKMNEIELDVYASNGPCRTKVVDGHSYDTANAFLCVCWPREANEWIHRTRLHGWPTQTMIHRIVQGGCHLVPVGDKCSTDTLLQWRISFVCAEQLLIHSLTHPQFRVYGLLKYFLFQIKELLKHIIGDDDILCSYFIKTVIFHAVENSPYLLWDGDNTFVCFRFCLSILIAWVRTGQCPNYFIRENNLFLRKVHGEARRKLLHFLTDLYDLKWMCFSHQSNHADYVGRSMQRRSLHSKLRSECERDALLFRQLYNHFEVKGSKPLYKSLKCLEVALTDVDEFIAYIYVVLVLKNIVFGLLKKYDNTRGNKLKYVVITKCSIMLNLTKYVSGILILASFYYITGNNDKTLRLCRQMMSTFRLFICHTGLDLGRYFEQYERLYCGKGYTLWHKLKEGVYLSVRFDKTNITLCPLHLHLEANNSLGLYLPPLPYAIFLSFLCYHELGDFRRRDTELINLRAANYDPHQGGQNYWIVHTLLGICYQIVGDIPRAIRSFRDSLRAKPDGNPAEDRIEALLNSR